MTPNREIIVRFFQALEILKTQGEISGVADFCRRFGFNRIRYINLKNHLDDGMYKNIEIEAIYILVTKFNFSSHWLITGQGVPRI